MLTEIKTEFDEGIGKINVVSQDIGRVLLNLYNNAFYAVNEKKQKLNGTFEPVVTVSPYELYSINSRLLRFHQTGKIFPAIPLHYTFFSHIRLSQ